MLKNRKCVGLKIHSVCHNYSIKAHGEKILFGTDTYAVGFQRGRIEYAMISERDKQNILRYNALKLFKDKLPKDGE